MKQYFTVAEVAALLRRTPATVRGWCRAGKIKADVSPGGRGYLIARDSLPGPVVETETLAERERRAAADLKAIREMD